MVNQPAHCDLVEADATRVPFEDELVVGLCVHTDLRPRLRPCFAEAKKKNARTTSCPSAKTWAHQWMGSPSGRFRNGTRARGNGGDEEVHEDAAASGVSAKRVHRKRERSRRGQLFVWRWSFPAEEGHRSFAAGFAKSLTPLRIFHQAIDRESQISCEILRGKSGGRKGGFTMLCHGHQIACLVVKDHFRDSAHGPIRPPGIRMP